MEESGKTNKKIEGSSKNLVKNSANAEINEITHIRMECIEEKCIESPRSKKKELEKRKVEDPLQRIKRMKKSAEE